ncbi:MauE/DoxX family redox-associated membrane protein, partial [Oryzihumus sp.]|uniref:MauE/DoxX family redox-associated membrane protein n=1 Tax=Oryzihumus sp. TaxID=1968903 RepID=UPI002ED9126C
RDPLPLVRALRSVGLPIGATIGRASATTRALAAAEVVLGIAAIARPAALTAGLVAVAYLAFTGFVGLALARGGVIASCGCFGKPDTPPTRAHLLVTALLAGAAAATAVAPPTGLLTAQPGQLVTAGYAVLVAFLAWLVIAVLPTTTPAAVRGPRSAPQEG